MNFNKQKFGFLALTVTSFCLFGFSGEFCVEERATPNQAGQGPIKLHHVSGKHLCQSSQHLGYSCSVDIRDAVDCDNGHQRLGRINCCSQVRVNDKIQSDGKSIEYMPGGCSVLF